VTGVGKALESQREAERKFVDRALQSETAPRGWPAALVMFHISTWRELMRNALTEFADHGSFAPPPEGVDEFNDARLPDGIGTPLADASARADLLLREIIDLYAKVGETPFVWYGSANTTEAVLRNSYTHPRLHLFEYCKENGLRVRALTLWEEARSDITEAGAPPRVMGAVLYNLACAKVPVGQLDDALRLLGESFQMRPDLKADANGDADLAPLRDDPRFKALISD